MVKHIIELQDAKGTKAKQAIIEKYSNDVIFSQLLNYALNPLITYNLSETTLILSADEMTDFKENKIDTYNDIFECFEHLSKLRGISNEIIKKVKYLLYMNYNGVDREVFIKILSKTLRLGVTAKTVNKIIPNLIPEWEVQQAFAIEKYPIPNGEEFWVTEKLNGVRATFINNELIARSGTVFQGLEHITKELTDLSKAGFVVDGELTLLNKNGLSDNEAFRVATGILNSDEQYKTKIGLTVFDIVPIDDFYSGNPTITYSERRKLLDALNYCGQVNKYVKTVPILYHGNDQSQISILLEQMVREDKEGLMINLNVPYKRTRHRGILKVKRFYTMDLPIVRFEEGSGRLKGKLGGIVVDYKNNEVKIGSGFTDEQRELIWNNQNDFMDLLCEVKYKEISYDKKTGLESLQFPIFVGFRNDKTTISYD